MNGQAQVVAEGTVAPQLAQVAAGQADIDTVVQNNSGAALQAEIQAAQVQNLIPTPTFSISSVALPEGDSGTTLFRFTVTPSGPSRCVPRPAAPPGPRLQRRLDRNGPVQRRIRLVHDVTLGAHLHALD